MPEIQKIKRKDLDTEKYSELIHSAVNHRIYAEYWYLDLTTEGKWECLVYGDYEAVMPIPLQYKLGFKFVLQPLYAQQLGVFYKKKISKEVFREFEKELHKYRVRSYHFNEENQTEYQPEGEVRINHILELNRPYEELRRKYKKGRKSDLGVARRHNFELTITDEIEQAVEANYTNYPFFSKQISKESMVDFLTELQKKNRLEIRKVTDKGNPSNIAYRVMLDSGKRKIMILAIRNKDFTHTGIDTFLLDSIIGEFSDSEFCLDFEGSNVPGIAFYNESFGAVKKEYCVFSNFSLRK